MTDSAQVVREAVMRYQGDPANPYPPHKLGWMPVAGDDDAARRGALSIRERGLLGAPWTFVDELVTGPGAGVYRFFAFDTPVGAKIGALRYVGIERALTMGQVASEAPPADQTPPDQGGPLPSESTAPPPGQGPGVWYGGVFISQTLNSTYAAMMSYLDTNGCTQDPFQECYDFQAAYNQQDPATAVNGPGQLTYDGKYGHETELAADGVAQVIGGAQPPANCFDGAGGTGPGGGGGTSQEPVPTADGSCSQWVADGTNAQVVAIANSIVFHNTPTPWKDQGHYDTTVGGQTWRIVMWQESGTMMAAVFRCAKPVASSSGGGGGLALGLGALATAAVVGAIVAFKGGAFA